MEFDTKKLKPAHLKRIRALADLNEDQLARFLQYVAFVESKQNDKIFHEGEEADCMFLILQGQVRFLTEKKRGRPYFLRYLEAGDSFGEIALIDGGLRSATAEACKESLLLKLDADALEKLIGEEPRLGNQVLLRICLELGAHLRDLTKRVGNDAALREVLQVLA